MSRIDIIKTVLEFFVGVFIVVGVAYEKKLIAFEEKLIRAIKIHLRNRYLAQKREEAVKNVFSSENAPVQKTATEKKTVETAVAKNTAPRLTLVKGANRVA